MAKSRAHRFSPEVRERAVRLVREQLPHHPSQWAAISVIAPKLGCTKETRRRDAPFGSSTISRADARVHLNVGSRTSRTWPRGAVLCTSCSWSTCARVASSVGARIPRCGPIWCSTRWSKPCTSHRLVQDESDPWGRTVAWLRRRRTGDAGMGGVVQSRALTGTAGLCSAGRV